MSDAAPVPPETAAVADGASARRRKRRWLLACALVALGLAGWWFGVELPERRAAAELKRKQAENARRIADLGLDLVWIPAGSFRMGTPAQGAPARWFYTLREKLTHQPNPDAAVDIHERPATWVTLTRPFWLGRTEVTQAQWQAVMGGNPSEFKGEDLPMDAVSWHDAMEFCRNLTERERAAGRLPKGYAYTLPTEAQWEYACRAGTTGDYAGNLDALAWFDKNSSGTPHPVGTKRANAWGLQDMEGNVWEWCADWVYGYRGGQVTNPTGSPSGSRRVRVVRSGSWNRTATNARAAFRTSNTPGVRSNILGFRLALASAPQTPASPAVSVP